MQNQNWVGRLWENGSDAINLIKNRISPQPTNGRMLQSAYSVIQPAFHKNKGEVSLVDTHVHTRYSDGLASVTEVEDICRAKDIGCLITDHNEIRGAMKLFEREKVPTLPAMEMGSKEQIELIVIFKEPHLMEEFFREQVEPFRRKRWYAFLPRSLEYLTESAAERGAIISVPHPFAPLWKNVDHGKKRRQVIHKALEGADCIEVLNGGLSRRANKRALHLCEQLGRIPLGGSDSHRLETIGSVVVAFQHAVTTANLFDTILNGQILGILGRDARPRYLTNAWQVAKRHSRRFIQPSFAPSPRKKYFFKKKTSASLLTGRDS